jgi:hypothetical protein
MVASIQVGPDPHARGFYNGPERSAPTPAHVVATRATSWATAIAVGVHGGEHGRVVDEIAADRAWITEAGLHRELCIVKYCSEFRQAVVHQLRREKR